MRVYLDQIQSVRNATAPAFRMLFNQIEPNRPMTDDEMWDWILTGKGPVREYPADPSVKMDLLYGHGVFRPKQRIGDEPV